MAHPIYRIVIARYKEDVTWVDKLPKHWTPVVIQKQTDELEGDMPNAGREPSSFLFAVAKHYQDIKPDDVWAFVQGNPFDHCPNFFDQLEVLSETEGYIPLGGHSTKVCDSTGAPDHPNLPIKRYYEKWLNRPCPDHFTFTPGGQFIVKGKDLLKYPRKWYLEVMDDVTPGWNAYIAERLWSEIYAKQG